MPKMPKKPKMLKAKELYKPEGKTFKGKFDKKFASKRGLGGKKKGKGARKKR